MEDHDFSKTSADVMYSATANDAFGVGTVRSYNDDYDGYFARYNRLLKRWNMPDSQANIYALSALGVVEKGRNQNAAGSLGIEMDAEDRRFYASYQNQYLKGGDIVDEFTEKFRVGIAPYIANYDELHTWLIMEVQHQPQQTDHFILQPMIRMFKGNYLWEAGISDHGDLALNFTMNF